MKMLVWSSQLPAGHAAFGPISPSLRALGSGGHTTAFITTRGDQPCKRHGEQEGGGIIVAWAQSPSPSILGRCPQPHGFHPFSPAPARGRQLWSGSAADHRAGVTQAMLQAPERQLGRSANFKICLFSAKRREQPSPSAGINTCPPSFNHTCGPLLNCEPFLPTGGSAFSVLTLFKFFSLEQGHLYQHLKFLLLCFLSQFLVILIASSSQRLFPSLFSSYCFLIFNSCQAKLLAKLFPSLFLKHFLKRSLTFLSQSFNYCIFHPVSFAGNFP